MHCKGGFFPEAAAAAGLTRVEGLATRVFGLTECISTLAVCRQECAIGHHRCIPAAGNRDEKKLPADQLGAANKTSVLQRPNAD
jgi:hypothetical protein